ncbi:MAG: GMC family oxidoreductase N-terminal domain-containing protein, partial [Chloroflexota bacterium]|nr:GMC family oxidoreductase N-terminal domain-containing protein [Chloroflexota bacterium]
LDESRHRLNLTVKAGCQVRRILFDDRRAVGLEVESGGQTFTVEGEDIVLSAGAVGSPHLMLLSGVGPEAQLAEQGIALVHNLPGVGRNLKDHPKIYITWAVPGDYPPQSRAAPGGTALRLTAPGSEFRNDLSISLACFVPPRTNEISPSLSEGQEAPRFVEMMVALLMPLSQGELR